MKQIRTKGATTQGKHFNYQHPYRNVFIPPKKPASKPLVELMRSSAGKPQLKPLSDQSVP